MNRIYTFQPVSLDQSTVSGCYTVTHTGQLLTIPATHIQSIERLSNGGWDQNQLDLNTQVFRVNGINVAGSYQDFVLQFTRDNGLVHARIEKPLAQPAV